MRIKDFCSVVNGFAFNSSLFNSSSDGFPVIRIRNLTYQTTTTFTTEAFPNRCTVNPGDILVSMDGNFTAVQWNSTAAALNQRVCKVSPNSPHFSKTFLRYALNSSLQKIENSTSYVTVKHLSSKMIETIDIPDEYLSSQNKIGRLFELIEKNQNHLERTSTLLDSLIKSRFIEMFGPNEGSVRLSTVCTLYNGDRGKNYPSGKDRVEEGIPFVNAGDLVDGRISFEKMDYITEERYKLLSGGKIERGDILYCLRGTLGKCAITDFSGGTIASSMMIIRPNQNKVLPAYLYQVLASPLVEKQLQSSRNGSTQPNLSAKSVGNYVIPLPHINRQREFTDFVARIDKLRFDVQQQIEKLETLKKSLMQEYFG